MRRVASHKAKHPWQSCRGVSSKYGDLRPPCSGGMPRRYGSSRPLGGGLCASSSFGGFILGVGEYVIILESRVSCCIRYLFGGIGMARCIDFKDVVREAGRFAHVP